MQPTWENEKYGIQLYRGDCRDVVPQLPASSIDAVITDPPYGTTACSWDSCIPFDAMWAFLRHVRKPNAAIVLTGSEPFSSFLRVSNIKEYKYDWVWSKGNGLNFHHIKNMPLKTVELISVFSNGIIGHRSQAGIKRMTYNPQGVKVSNIIKKQNIQTMDDHRITRKSHKDIYKHSGSNYPNVLLVFPAISNSVHPTQKPVALMEYLIRTYTNPGDTVLDFTMGSGTTGVAAVNTGRKFVGIEMDSEKHGDKYFRIAVKRIHDAIGKAESDMFR